MSRHSRILTGLGLNQAGLSDSAQIRSLDNLDIRLPSGSPNVDGRLTWIWLLP